MTLIVLYVVLAVLAVILLLLLFILFSPLSVRICYRDGVAVYAGLSFIKFKVFPQKEMKNKKKKEKNKKTAEKYKEKYKEKEIKQEKAENGAEKGEKKGSLKDTLSLILEIVKSVFEMMGKKAKIKIDALNVVVSQPDAADTAVYFGICNGIVMTLLAFTSNFGKAVIKDDNVGVVPDFISGKSKIETDITLSARTISILWSLLRGYMKNMTKKNSTEREIKNDR